jgi:ankyrin repeat protein
VGERNKPLIAAIERRDVFEVKRLLQSGVDANTTGQVHRPALSYAVLNDSLEIARELLAAGASPNAVDDNGWAPLHFVAQEWLPAFVSLLIDGGAAIDPQDEHGSTPLWRAVYGSQGRGEVIEALLQKGADPERGNARGVSPRELAATIANYDVARFFRKS